MVIKVLFEILQNKKWKNMIMIMTFTIKIAKSKIRKSINF